MNISSSLCGKDSCRRIKGHSGSHDPHPSEAWSFLDERDRKKIQKAGFATPRGGDKGAYQNHVVRSSKVIVPYERLHSVDLSQYRDGYVVRLLPHQYFGKASTPRPDFLDKSASIRVGTNAFVLYRTHESLAQFPPPQSWQVRSLRKDGQIVQKRGAGVEDVGHYVLRIPRLGSRPKRFEGPPQGVFAPEYADNETNFRSKCVLALLMIYTKGSPYTTSQASHLIEILRSEDLYNSDYFEHSGVLRSGRTSCPLCLRVIQYQELHDTVSFADQDGLSNAAEQVDGSTRSTIINLFHLQPLLYQELTHGPWNVGWGHAICNTRLGQRRCYSLRQLQMVDRKVGVLDEEGIFESFGWISEDWLMIRSPNGAVWMQLNKDVDDGPLVTESEDIEQT